MKCWCGGAIVPSFDGKNALYQHLSVGATHVVVQPACAASAHHDPLDVAPTGPVRTLYIAGPMTGYPDCNYPAFHAAAKLLQEAGYETVNPADIDTGASYREIIKGDIVMMMDCDGIATLEGCELSTGAWLEVSIAGVLQKPVRPVAEWVQSRQMEVRIES